MNTKFKIGDIVNVPMKVTQVSKKEGAIVLDVGMNITYQGKEISSLMILKGEGIYGDIVLLRSTSYFDGVKAGDDVWDTYLGNGFVTDVFEDGFEAEFSGQGQYKYTFDGKISKHRTNMQALFKSDDPVVLQLKKILETKP